MRNFQLFNLIISVPAVLIAFTVQGYAKALVADKLGDKTPRFQGRLTLNPIAHIDLVGFIMILLFHFGWTKPLETNPRAYKRGYKDAIKVSIAAPIGNLIAAFIGMFIYVFLIRYMGTMLTGAGGTVLLSMVYAVVSVNVSLCVFNLLPLPGLAGFEILRDLAPKHFYKIADKIYQYQFLILMVVVFVGSSFLYYPVSFIINLFYRIVRIIL